MERKHFLERLEHDNDYQREYIKAEKFCSEVRMTSDMYNSINEFISQNFWKWEDRSTFSSFEELREYMGFKVETDKGRRCFAATEVDMNGYFSFCEMILTLVFALNWKLDSNLHEVRDAMIKTMQAVIAKAGFEIKETGREVQIVQQNAVASDVADKVEPVLAEKIIEYNHYLLRGNIEKKKQILKQITDALEPKRAELRQIQYRETEDYFNLVNNMNIRHNNLDPKDTKRFNHQFSTMTPDEQESWYDLIYEQALGLFVALEQQDRNKRIDKYRQSERSTEEKKN